MSMYCDLVSKYIPVYFFKKIARNCSLIIDTKMPRSDRLTDTL